MKILTAYSNSKSTQFYNARLILLPVIFSTLVHPFPLFILLNPTPPLLTPTPTYLTFFYIISSSKFFWCSEKNCLSKNLAHKTNVWVKNHKIFDYRNKNISFLILTLESSDQAYPRQFFQYRQFENHWLLRIFYKCYQLKYPFTGVEDVMTVVKNRYGSIF